MKVKKISILALATAGVFLAINVPIGRFLFSDLTAATVAQVTSWLEIHGDEAIGDFLVAVALLLSLFLSISAVCLAHLIITWRNRKKYDVE
jgi:hypothetical protein